MAAHNAEVPQDRRIEFRLGVNIGDIIIEGRDIFGDGVNVAARLQEIAAPGGVCVSELVDQQVRDKLETTFTDLGEQQFKNIARPVRIYRVALGGRAPAERPPLALPDKPSIAALPVPHAGPRGQEIMFCRTKDGVNLATACVGNDLPLVSIPTWPTHLQYDWQSPASTAFAFLADRFRLIRYHCRGFGLSDRDSPTFPSLRSRVTWRRSWMPWICALTPFSAYRRERQPPSLTLLDIPNESRNWSFLPGLRLGATGDPPRKRSKGQGPRCLHARGMGG